MEENKTIILAEDEQMLQQMYSLKLGSEGYNVIIAKDGYECLEKMKSANPKLVLLDLIMPRKNGFDVLENVSKDEKLKDIPIIVLSSLLQEDDVKLAKSLGAKDYLVKSNIMLNDLIVKVAQFIKK